MPDFNRQRPDDDLVETEFAAFDGFWQYQFLDAGPKPANGDLTSRLSPQFLAAALAPGLLA